MIVLDTKNKLYAYAHSLELSFLLQHFILLQPISEAIALGLEFGDI